LAGRSGLEASPLSSKKRFESLNDIARHIAAGFGAGEGAQYKPWLHVRDVPSHGRSHIEWSEVCQREHHLLSDHEHRYFLIQIWRRLNIDLRECFPLPLDDTLQIAKHINIRHPIHPKTGVPVVITTDFLLTREGTDKNILIARSIKPADVLNDPKRRRRVLEKEQIQHAYWAGVDVQWALVTDRQINRTLASNLDFLYQSVRDDGVRNDDAGVRSVAEAALAHDWSATPACALLPRLAAQVGRSDEETVKLFKLALWRGALTTDLDARQLHFAEPIGAVARGALLELELRKAA
jgi:hypothetical protein